MGYTRLFIMALPHYWRKTKPVAMFALEVVLVVAVLLVWAVFVIG